MLDDMRSAPKGQIFVLHACAHNPTGIDPTEEQWQQIADVMSERGHFPFFDCAYQGFATGDVDRDAYAIRLFVDRGFELLVAESFAKNMGLYGERTGCLHAVCQSSEVIPQVSSQLNRLSRATISTASAYGAKIAATVLQDPRLYEEWLQSMQDMSQRIKTMRDALRDKLVALGTPGSWDHVSQQIGMFSFTGLSKLQVDTLRNQYHLYMTDDGRISVAGLNSHNIDYVAQSIDAVVRSSYNIIIAKALSSVIWFPIAPIVCLGFNTAYSIVWYTAQREDEAEFIVDKVLQFLAVPLMAMMFYLSPPVRRAFKQYLADRNENKRVTRATKASRMRSATPSPSTNRGSVCMDEETRMPAYNYSMNPEQSPPPSPHSTLFSDEDELYSNM
ncbi:Aspartate aminotransferase, cytoplasmic [Coemansia sp. S100]|nr:Aspartate aminotransferase, cytoplasmic [Coemansia sp. S100]